MEKASVPVSSLAKALIPPRRPFPAGLNETDEEFCKRI